MGQLLVEKELDVNDIDTLKSRKTESFVPVLVIPIFSILFITLITQSLYFLTLLLSILFCTYVYKLILNNKDFNEKIKLCGELTVINKREVIDSEFMNHFEIFFDCSVLKKIIIKEENWRKVQINDIIYIEICKNSKFILKLNHNKIDFGN